jgi:mycothiol system anti-sigma-R factor
MHCHEAQKFVYVYLDGEFGDGEHSEFEAHVSECDACRKLVQSEHAFQKALKEKLPAQTAPAHLRTSILAQIREIEKETSGSASLLPFPTAFKFVPVALAAAILLVVMWPQQKGQLGITDAPLAAGFVDSESPVTLAASAAQSLVKPVNLARYNRMPADVRGDEPDIRKYMQERVSFKVWAPLPKREGVTLLGAREVVVQARPTVLFMYDYAGERVSVLQYPDGVVSRKEASLRVNPDSGVTYGFFKVANKNFLVVSEVSPEKLSGILPAQ